MDIARHFTAPRRDQPVSIGIGLSGLIPHRGLRAAVSLAGLAGSLYYVATSITLGWTGAPLAALVSTVVAGLSWLAWQAVDAAGTGPGALSAASATLAAAGGVLATSGHAGLVFVGVGAGGAAIAFDLPVAVVPAATGPAAFLVTAGIRGTLPGPLLSVALVTLVGLVGAAGRREMVQRARQQTLIATARERAEVIRREAELVGERNRLGRELHDVLAHTLGALSIQLTALDTLVRTGASRDDLRREVERGHQLVGEGLDEARQAVRALRDDQTPLDGQLRKLAQQHRAAFEVTGPPRPLRPEPTLTLYRVAQEALTNAAKHAPGAPVAVHVTFDNDGVKIVVRNARPEAGPGAGSAAGDGAGHPLRGSGGGYGLPGMAERVEQAGGRCQAGPDGDGWQVTAFIPADPR
jgi:signal transduction histidine kinase